MKTNQGDRNTNQPPRGLMQNEVSSAMGKLRSGLRNRFRWTMPTLPKRFLSFSAGQRGIWAILIWAGTLVLTGCSPPVSDSSTLNSRYTDEQPSLSGNGQFLAFVSSRDGANQVLLYDLKARTFVALPGLNSSMMIAQNPSLSRNARYIAYLGNNQGKLDIFVYDRLTQRPEIVTLGYKNLIRRPALSPDGRYLVFETDRRGQWDIEVIDRGTGIELDKPEG